MKGDILIINDQHRGAAEGVFRHLRHDLSSHSGRYIITIAGESGAGKSEIAYALAHLLEKAEIQATIIQQDDFFIYPPKTNAEMRLRDIAHVGPQEVRLDLLDEIVGKLHTGIMVINKPLVIFEEDSITTESIDLSAYRVVIIEGTYTSLIPGVDCRVFIDRDYIDTREDRQKRNRENQDDYLEKILAIEHGIISGHKAKADLIVTKDFQVISR